jgi:hypothetical protein
VKNILLKWEIPSEKGNLFKIYYMPILTCDKQTWRWTKAHISELSAAEMQFLRSIK